MSNAIELHDVAGIAVKQGTDQHGNLWRQFDVDLLAMQLPGYCDICDAEIMSGWLCLDGGEEVCGAHVVVVDDRVGVS